MTQGFYEQIGVPIDADFDQLRAAYGRAVAHLLKRREATVSQGGDPSALDLARAQLDEAWQVLSDPARRRRYDAMLAVAGDGTPRGSVDDLWTRVAGAMIHPSVAAAARLVDGTTKLQLGPLPEPPRPPGARPSSPGWEEDVTVTARVQATLREAFGNRRPVARVQVDPQLSTTGSGAPAVPPDTVVEEAGRPTSPPSSGAADPAGQVGRGRPSDGTARVAAVHTRLATNAAAAGSPAANSGSSGAEVAGTSAPSVQRVAVVVPPLSEAQRLLQVHGPTGALLRAAREGRRMTLLQMAEATRISVRYLEAVENEDYAALPSAAAFVRGYVREMARLLDLDVERVVAGYLRRFSGDG